MRFLDAFAPGKSIAALRIPHKGTSTEQRGVLDGARPASNQIMRFFRRNVPNKASAALRIPHKGTSTEQRECPRCKARLESDHAVFQAQCAEQSFCRAPYSAQGNIHRAAGVLEGARPASNQIMQFFRRNAPNKAFAALRIPHKGTSTEQRGCSRGQGPPRIEFCGFLRHSPEKTAPELLAPGRPRSYGNGGCNTHMTARC